MGALASDYINIATNNPSYVGKGSFTAPPASPAPITGLNVAKEIAYAGAGKLGKTILPRNPYLFGVKTAYDIALALDKEVNGEPNPNGTTSNADAMALGADVDASVSQYVDLLKYNQEYTKKLEDELEALKNGIGVQSGDTLPSVLVGNTKALVTTLGSFTTVFNEKFDTLNGALTGMLVYFNDLMTLKSEEIPLNIEAMKFQKSSMGIVDNYSGSITPREVEVMKNASLLDSLHFQKATVSSGILEAKNLSGLSPREIQVSKHSYDVEAKEYAKAPQSVKDWDENILADISPREARLVKDATVAIDTTDKINFELDTEDIDIVLPIDISRIYGYEKNSEIFQDLYSKFGGLGTL